MHAFRTVCDSRPPVRLVSLSLASFLILACVFFAASAGAAGTAPAAPPRTPPDRQYTPPGDGKTHEDYNLPQDQWGRAYREGLRQGYDAGRQFPQQLDQAYRQGINDGYQAWQLDDETYQRTQRLYQKRDDAIKAGREAFGQAAYDQAADLFLLASQLDNGDPASRLYGTQALFAVGQYEQAIPLLRRAFELQPNLVYLRFDLRLDYADPADFGSQLADLQALVAANPNWSGGCLLLGYELLHSGQRNQAYQAFTRAARLDPMDALARKFLKVSYPLPPRPAPKAAAPTPPPGPIAKPRPVPAQPAAKATPSAHKA